MRRSMVFCSLVLVLCLTSALAYAQSASTATITGQVVDPQGAVIPNAKVTATNVATGVGRSVNTTGTGNYTLPNLPPGTYTVKVAAAKFAVGEAKDVKLNVGDSRDLNFKLPVATASQTVEVTAEAPLIETTKTEVSTSVTDVDMQKLPTFAAISGGANDFASLALTAPGVKMDTSTLTGDLIGPGSMNNRGNLYNVDGANITDQLVSGRDGVGASVDEIQEFQVLTNNYNAEYGQAGGLVINAVTKSGTNQFHGDGHMYFRGRNLQASDPFYNLSLFQSAIKQSAPPTGVGGPSRCPDADFTAGVLTKLDGCPRTPFHRKEGGFTIGGPLIKNKLFFFGSYEDSRQAAPTILTPPSGAVAVQQPINNLLWSGKLDWKINEKHSFSARYNVDRIRQDNLVVQTGHAITPDSLVANLTDVSTFNAGFVSTITPTLVNEARFAFVRTASATPDKTTKPGQQHPGFYTGADFCCPQGGLNKRYQYLDNVSWSHGKHTWKAGGSISYYPWFSLFQQFHFGQYGDFTTPTTPGSFTFGSGPGAVTSKDNIYGFYVQDMWKPFHNLTVNYGIRYDYEAGAFKGGTVKGPGGTCFQGSGIVPACSSDKNNWQPRLGFTWEIRPGTLFKASGGEVTQLAFNNVVLDSLNFDGKNLRTQTTTNPLVLAAFPNFPSPALLVGPACPPKCGRVRPISPNIKNPEIHMFNASIQHEFSKTLVGEIQYIGQFGSGLFGERDVNSAPVVADPAHPGFFYFAPRPDQRFSAIRTNENSRTSQYNGMLISVTKRMSHHISFLGSYTWSHAITSGEDFFGLSEPGDPRNIKAERGPAFNDARHAVNFSAIYDTGRLTQTNVLRWFTNDVTLGGIFQAQSGRPYPFSTGTAGFADGRFFGAGNETQQRPNVLPDGTISSSGIASAFGSNALFSGSPASTAICTFSGFTAAQCASFVNTFTAPGAADGNGSVDFLSGETVDFKFLNGNMGRDAGRGSPFYRTDMSLKKSFKVPRTESVKIELQADALNIFNHTNWQGFNTNNALAAFDMAVTRDLSGNIIALNPNFFTCNNCLRPNGTYIGNSGQVLHLSDLQNGKLSKNLLNPAFGGSAFALAGFGDPATADGSRLFQLSFHVRF
jgi:hypothetical protein